MRTVMILIGLPGAGKSTFAKELLRNEPRRWKRVNRDDLRALLDGENFIKENEEFIRHDCKDRISKLEALLAESSKEKDEMRQQILELVSEVASLRTEIKYLPNRASL